ncbi:MAG: hypothetical protein ACK5KU_04555 [Beutenbergiaceae bacterium]
MSSRRIALISATPLAITPASDAIAETLPHATVWNLLDDQLLKDAQQQGRITEPLEHRMDALIAVALQGGADGVVLTCSQYGQRAQVRDRQADQVPVLSADGPLFDEVLGQAPRRALLVASLPAAAQDSMERLGAALAQAGLTTTLTPLVVPDAARPRPAQELAAILQQAIDGEAAFDLVVLAQYSLAPAAPDLRRHLSVPVLDGPSAAARRLQAEIGG